MTVMNISGAEVKGPIVIDEALEAHGRLGG